MLIQDGYEATAAHLEDSETAELCWALAHLNTGPHLVGCWYRPPAPGEVESIQCFEREFHRLSKDTVAAVVVGDMNVHNPGWLCFSRRDTPEGKELQRAAANCQLVQKVKQPTRKKYLLDLVLTNAGTVSVTVHPKVADHAMVEVALNSKLEQPVTTTRKVWTFTKADWEGLKGMLAMQYWSPLETLNA